jgi:hypothetical protein
VAYAEAKFKGSGDKLYVTLFYNHRVNSEALSCFIPFVKGNVPEKCLPILILV